MSEKTAAKLLFAAVLSAATVMAGSLAVLSKGLPDKPAETLQYPIESFKFVFGSGIPVTDRMRVDQFANGYALLSSGPVSIRAKQQRVLSYTWLPPKVPGEAAFFWRRGNDQQNVLRTEITAAGTHQLDLSAEREWRGEITEFGFLLAGVNGESIEMGNVTLIPDSLDTRLRLAWHAWTTFEEWSQQSINFLQGGDYRQIVALPLLIAAWLLLTLLLFWMFSKLGLAIDSRRLLITAGMVFLIAWLLLDIRWTTNNIRQIQLSLRTKWLSDDEQRSSNDLDGGIYQYIQRLKTEVLPDDPARILIIGDENAVDYYLLRAKYHLLPHSVNVVGRLGEHLVPESLDYIIFFGQPNGISKVPGWSSSWERALSPIDRGEWGVVYRSKQDT